MSFELSEPCVHLQECVATNTQVINPADKKNKKIKGGISRGRESVRLCLAFSRTLLEQETGRILKRRGVRRRESPNNQSPKNKVHSEFKLSIPRTGCVR